MYPYNIPYIGRDTQVFTHPKYTTSTVVTVQSGVRQLTLSDPGTYSGDFKTPNSFEFMRSHTPPGSLQRYTFYAELNTLGHSRRWAGDPGPQDSSHGFRMPTDWGPINDHVLKKLYEKLRGGSNLAVDIAERNATIRMLKNARSLRKYVESTIKDAKRTNRYKRAKGPNRLAVQADIISSKWLEYRYGWLPLMYSTFELLEEIHRHVFGGLILVKSRSRFTDEDNLTEGKGTEALPYKITKTTNSWRREVGIYFQIPDNKNVWDFTSLNPIGIAYELMTLSFVLDWFTNIGDTLELWENHVIFSQYFKSGYQTDSRKEMRGVSRMWYNSRPVEYIPGTIPALPVTRTYIWSGHDTGRTTVTWKKRTRLLSLPRPAGFRIKVDLNAKRYADAVALLWTFVRRR